MASTLREICCKLEKQEGHHPWDDLGHYHEIRANPENYILIKLKEKRMSLWIRKDNIPKIGTIVTYADNELYDIQDHKYKSEFPELSTKKNIMVIEQVDDIHLTNLKMKLELKISRYLVQENINSKSARENYR